MVRTLFSTRDQAQPRDRDQSFLNEAAEEADWVMKKLAERWEERESEREDESQWVSRRKSNASRLRVHGTIVDKEVAFVHDEVVKKLRRKQYKAGWRIHAKLRVLPDIWSDLQSEFAAAGAAVEDEGDKVVVTIDDPDIATNVFEEDRMRPYSVRFDIAFERRYSKNENPRCNVIF